MKTIFLLLTAFLLTFTNSGIAQSLKIVGKTVKYNRPKTIDQEHKRTFEITYPKVTGAMGKKIERALDYEKIFGISLKEQLSGEDLWLSEIHYDLKYNKNNVLSIAMQMEGSSAYPSVSIVRKVIDARSGTLVKPSDVFVNLRGLAARTRTMQKTEIETAQADYKKDPDSADFDGSDYFKNATFAAKDLGEFSVSDKGVTFHYDYGFPHVVLALQPSGEYFFSWKQLRPFVKPGSLFAPLAK